MTETKVRKQYNRMAAEYDSRWSRYIDNTLSFLKNWAEIPSNATVLDLACGTGEFERLLLNEHPTQTIFGVDISEKMLAIARTHHGNLTGQSELGKGSTFIIQLPLAFASKPKVKYRQYSGETTTKMK